MVKLISSLVRANLSIGINEETGHVGELTAEQLTLAATTSFDRAVQVRLSPALPLASPVALHLVLSFGFSSQFHEFLYEELV